MLCSQSYPLISDRFLSTELSAPSASRMLYFPVLVSCNPRLSIHDTAHDHAVTFKATPSQKSTKKEKITSTSLQEVINRSKSE